MSRTKSVLLRLTEEEHSRLKELAGREPVSAYLRRVASLGEAEGIASESRSATAKDSGLAADAPSPPRPPAVKLTDARGNPVPVQAASTLPRPGCKCPVSSCDYRAGSLAARCPRHGRLVVPA